MASDDMQTQCSVISLKAVFVLGPEFWDGSGPAPGDRDAMSRSAPPPGVDGVEVGRSAPMVEVGRSAAPPASIIGTPAGEFWAREIRYE